ncbi:histone-lysine N-methyltransferase SUV39H2-like [Planococcus citri]|uniref:histone-lysine N-methyltransferase SUV39H2-like n=1 Tax=Planococcus citri TaxID=170843 RepID=UPI0031F72755
MAIKLNLNFLEVQDIIDHKIEDNEYIFCVLWSGSNVKSWVNTEFVSSFPLHVLLRYFATFIGSIDNILDVDIIKKVEKVESLICKSCTKSELNKMVQSYLTISGLKLPASKRSLVQEELIDYIKSHTSPTLRQMEDLRRKIILEWILELREVQLLTLQQMQLEINLISDNEAEITVENNVDLEVLPANFTYVNNNVPGYGVTIPTDPPIGCNCLLGCAWSKQKIVSGSCCTDNADVEPAYDDNKRLIFTKRKPIYECNKKCTCDKSCPNRVVQNGTNVKLEIFRTFNDCGWGVRTLEYVRKGTFIARYVGEVITFEEAKNRCDEYLFDIDLNYASVQDECAYTVDAIKYGNVSRFINHSCDPNLCVFGVFTDCLDPDLHEIAFFAARDIIPGEEISFDYKKKMICKCGSIKCKLK